MAGKIVRGKFALTLTFSVFLLFLISNTAIAHHHHALDDLSHGDCPICATAHVTSFAAHDFTTPIVQQTSITVSVLLPHEFHSHINPIFLTHLNNRAPPK
jgi:hypothetical protein